MFHIEIHILCGHPSHLFFAFILLQNTFMKGEYFCKIC